MPHFVMQGDRLSDGGSRTAFVSSRAMFGASISTPSALLQVYMMDAVKLPAS
jgi:hypothetical protein